MHYKLRRESAAPLLANKADSRVRVFYQYFYHHDDRHVVEKVVGYRCSFCEMPCRSLTVRVDRLYPVALHCALPVWHALTS